MLTHSLMISIQYTGGGRAIEEEGQIDEVGPQKANVSLLLHMHKTISLEQVSDLYLNLDSNLDAHWRRDVPPAQSSRFDVQN